MAEQVIKFLRSTYADFGPTLAAEKLRIKHGIDLAKETVRQLQIAVGLWIPRKLRPPKIHQRRLRRRFRMHCIGIYRRCDKQIEHGKPLAFYSDKASIFRVNEASATDGDGHTQFGQALFEQNIDGICANTPAAKGRVERAHLTMQDRPVKELRLESSRPSLQRDVLQGSSKHS
jgi:hypothetical protein